MVAETQETVEATRRSCEADRTRPPVVSIFRPEGLANEPPLPFVRRDALSDSAHYPDTGCEIARRCLACPLPRCQYDDPGSVRAWLSAARDREIARLRKHHRAPIEVLAQTYNLERRTIFRILGEPVPVGAPTVAQSTYRRTPRGSRLPLKSLTHTPQSGGTS